MYIVRSAIYRIRNQKMSKQKESSTSISDDESTSSCSKTCFEFGESTCCIISYKEEVHMTFEGYEIHKEQCESSDISKNRFYCYREFTRIVYGYLGKNNRIELPSCIVKQIHNMYPDKSGKYVGFNDGVKD